MRSILFDFNGTLFSDSDKHKNAWYIFSKRYGKSVTEDEIIARFLGRSNAYILTSMFGADTPDAEIARMTLEKEGIYRELCLADKQNFHLVAGVEEFLDYISSKRVNFTIATGAEISNVNFYFEYMGLSKWFDRDKVVLDDGTYKGKPAPDCYLLAAKKIGADPADCVVFEDSPSGLRSAYAAGVAKIALISASWDKDVLERSLPTLPPVNSVTPDFTDMIRIWNEELSK